ncbi:hypothetical protein F4009_04705 [Candidatus Poribacteria bacterium]|nr:hypothetical protein [Candidatus Poribacteria bacterium]MYH80353.1 hypothetical protein [Candidatus Poribacteria bacterium]MYK93290.1 hypothetical protein [Candidatus Poribacteria bacterium]
MPNLPLLNGMRGGNKMKGKFAYIVCFLLVLAFYAGAADVSHIAFTSKRDGELGIYIMDINGKNLQQLTNQPQNEFRPAFSPNRQRMAYVSTRDGNLEIYVMHLPTKVSHRLTNHPGFDDKPAWSADGQWIAFDSNRAGLYDIYKIRHNGENLQRLTHQGNNYHPAWSPDGLIAFDSKDGIHVMDSDGGNLRHLVNQPRAGKTPSWSPDGKQIAFSDMILGGNWDIYTLNVDGSNLRRMTRHPSKDMFPVWSPDGRSIVFYSRWNEKYDIYLIKDVASRHAIQLTEHPEVDRSPTWVPVGFFLSVPPKVNTQATLWGRLKQSVGE